MTAAWMAFLGVIVGSVSSLLGSVLITRLQWKHERLRWNEQRERDTIQWQRQLGIERDRIAEDNARAGRTRTHERDLERDRRRLDQQIDLYMTAIALVQEAEAKFQEYMAELDPQGGFTDADAARAREIRSNVDKARQYLPALLALCDESCHRDLNRVESILDYFSGSIEAGGVIHLGKSGPQVLGWPMPVSMLLGSAHKALRDAFGRAVRVSLG
ncbi:hypothetical protein AB0C33_36110 [Nonomuraea sp. NPDC048881]|uniref:hypothetical protein n=1 Tax=Nonomuraea sp. NPDC048881 TaxID=3155030 RepID=UPI0033C81666